MVRISTFYITLHVLIGVMQPINNYGHYFIVHVIFSEVN